MTTFSAPAVIEALVTAFSAIPSLTTIDGPAPDVAPEDLLQVATGARAIQDTPEHEPGLSLAQWERYSVNSRLWSRRGNGTHKDRRDACYVFLAAIKTAIDADKTLGGACLWAQMGRSDGAAMYAGTAKAYVLDFAIDVRARVP